MNLTRLKSSYNTLYDMIWYDVVGQFLNLIWLYVNISRLHKVIKMKGNFIMVNFFDLGGTMKMACRLPKYLKPLEFESAKVISNPARKISSQAQAPKIPSSFVDVDGVYYRQHMQKCNVNPKNIIGRFTSK